MQALARTHVAFDKLRLTLVGVSQM